MGLLKALFGDSSQPANLGRSPVIRWPIGVGKKTGFIDVNGNVVIPPKYDRAGDFHEGFAQAAVNNKYGFVDEKGSWLIQPKYDTVMDFSEGLAQVRLNDKWVIWTREAP